MRLRSDNLSHPHHARTRAGLQLGATVVGPRLWLVRCGVLRAGATGSVRALHVN